MPTAVDSSAGVQHPVTTFTDLLLRLESCITLSPVSQEVQSMGPSSSLSRSKASAKTFDSSAARWPAAGPEVFFQAHSLACFFPGLCPQQQHARPQPEVELLGVWTAKAPLHHKQHL
jgi:hypothetical protein